MIAPSSIPCPDPTVTDLELIAALNAGDPNAFEMIYYRHRDWIVGMAFRMTKDRDAAFTVLQETFRYFADKFPGFSLTCQLRTFLYPVVKNLSLMELRQAARVNRVREELVIEETGVTEPGNASLNDELEVLLNGLSPDHREVITMRYVDDMEVNEVALALNIPAGTVKSRLHHAVRQLRASPHAQRCFMDATQPSRN